MHRLLFVGLLSVALLEGCEEKPRKQEITYPKDFADTQACQSQCKDNNLVALAQGEVCVSQCELAFDRARNECNQFAGKDETRWKACRLQAMDRYAACQDTCAEKVLHISNEYDRCMQECQSAASKE